MAKYDFFKLKIVKILYAKVKTIGGAHVNNHMVGLWVVQWLLAIWLLLGRQF